MAKNSNFLFKLDLIILSVLKEKDCYGYELTKIIDERSQGLIVPKIGTMYPVLHDLLANQYISSYEVYIGTKARIYYHLEESGVEHLKELVNQYVELTKAINTIIKEEEVE